MKYTHHIVVTVILLLFTFTTVVYTACNKDECKDVQCLNGGSCADGNCNCPDGYSGTNCETKDPCKDIVCLNGGTCLESKCMCPTGYSGDSCQTEVRSFLYKTYIGDGTDDNGFSYEAFALQISSGGTAVNKLKARLWPTKGNIRDTLDFIFTLKADGLFDIDPGTEKFNIVYSGSGILTVSQASLKLIADYQGSPYDTVIMDFPKMIAQ